ncbi:SDR family oxidoreductase [Cupriavidus basilensis]|uniref:SDR family oxidoreductase n=1 Tax=Cupriavidus basilensis TaxID=68895 RepID=A0ABT6AQD4_9BURK|nr:SDR family oxidoreductase [Cupriavidus basilensis]MDF3834811.1 SDR family oxidoreductase [Cupriavidus basilensis]
MMWDWHASLNAQDLVRTHACDTRPAGVECLLLTGATGFIGGNVMVAAINAGLAERLLCLVRGNDAADALERLRANAIQCGLLASRAAWLTVDNVLLGSLDSDFAPAAVARLACVTHVINCAAMASFSSNAQVTRINVRDTLRFASRFADSPALRRFVHVGTAMACGTRRGTRGPRGTRISEQDASGDDASHLVPYTRSKQQVELLLRRDFPGLPLVVARPSIVVGHTVLGTQPSASIFWLFRIIHRARRYTAGPLTRIDVIAADDCAQALLRLALKPDLRFDAYHLSAGAGAPTIAQVVAAMDEAALSEDAPAYRMCPASDLPVLAHDVARTERISNRRLIERALRLYSGFAELGYVFDNGRIREEIDFQPLSITDYVSECMRTSHGVGILEQMSWDFKA